MQRRHDKANELHALQGSGMKRNIYLKCVETQHENLWGLINETKSSPCKKKHTLLSLSYSAHALGSSSRSCGQFASSRRACTSSDHKTASASQIRPLYTQWHTTWRNYWRRNKKAITKFNGETNLSTYRVPQLVVCSFHNRGDARSNLRRLACSFFFL